MKRFITETILDPVDALAELGFDTSKASRGRIMIRQGKRVRHYAFRLRLRDGAVLTRRGRMTRARRNSFTGLIVFDQEARKS